MAVSAEEEQRRAKLLDRLRASLQSPKACFALLFTFFPDSGHVGAVETELKTTPFASLTELPIEDVESKARGTAFLPRRLSPARPDDPKMPPLQELFDDLQQLQDFAEFDVQALRWLMRLDQELAGLSPGMFPTDETFTGLDDKNYWVRRTNNALAYYLNHHHDEPLDEGELSSLPPGVTWAASQAPSLKAYCRKCTLVPQESSRTWSHAPILLENERAGKRAATRMSQEWDSHRLRVLIWPFRVPVRFADVPIDNTISPRTIANDQEVRADALSAIAQARSDRATILLFPELSISLETEQAIQAELANHQSGDYPILTIGGRTLREIGNNNTANEAFVLGPSGELLLAHRKLGTFELTLNGIAIREGGTHFGNQVGVLESALGNLAVLICLDLLHPGLKEVMKKAAYANVLFVPSLSPQTAAHETSANEHYFSSLASTFVCNHRWCGKDDAVPNPLHARDISEGASFWRIAHAERRRRFQSHPSDSAYFSFDLTNFVAKQTEK